MLIGKRFEQIGFVALSQSVVNQATVLSGPCGIDAVESYVSPKVTHGR